MLTAHITSSQNKLEFSRQVCRYRVGIMAYYDEESNMEDYCYEQQEYASEYDEEVISDHDADMGNHETSDD